LPFWRFWGCGIEFFYGKASVAAFGFRPQADRRAGKGKELRTKELRVMNQVMT